MRAKISRSLACQRGREIAENAREAKRGEPKRACQGRDITVAEESIILKLWIVLSSGPMLTMYRLLAFSPSRINCVTPMGYEYPWPSYRIHNMTNIHREDTFRWYHHTHLVGRYPLIIYTFPWMFRHVYGCYVSSIGFVNRKIC